MKDQDLRKMFLRFGGQSDMRALATLFERAGATAPAGSATKPMTWCN